MKRWGIDSVESWLVAVAISLEILLISWPERVRGQIFLTILEYFETTKKMASFPFSLAFLMRSISGPVVGFFGNKYGLKEVTVVGCFLSSIGIFGCFFAKDILAVDILLGVVYGLGFGIATSLSPEIINKFFKKHRAKANGITFAGSALGGFITPPIVDVLVHEYGLSGTFLVMSAALLNTIPLMMLIKKPVVGSKTLRENIDKTSTSSEALREHSNEIDSVQTAEIHVDGRDHMNKKVTKTDGYENSYPGAYSCNSCFEQEDKFSKSEKSYLLSEFKSVPKNYFSVRERKTTFSTLEQSIKQTEQPIMCESSFCEQQTSESAEESELLELDLSVDSDGNVVHDDDICNTEHTNAASSFRVLWSPVFIFIAFIQSAHFYIEFICWTIIVDVTLEKEVEESQGKYFVMGLSLFDMIGRITLGFLTDNLYMSRATYCAICFIIMGLACAILPWVSGFILTMAVICLLGLICGANTTGLPGLVTKFIRKDQRTMAMSSRLVLMAPMTFTMPYLIEYFKENIGSYDGLFYVLTGLCILCATLLLLTRSRCRPKNNQNN